MLVNFFSVRWTNESSSIDELYDSFGENIPKYLPLEGGTGVNYLFCVKGCAKDIFEICKNHKYKVNGFCLEEDEFDDYSFKKIEVDDDKYNNNYYACPTFYEKDLYKLSKIKSFN
jgi:hypothetical protein